MRVKSIYNMISMTSTLAVVFAFAAANASAQVSTPIQTATCSSATLSGRYAHLVQGAYGAPTYGSAYPFMGIQTLVFDGKGTIKGSESFVAGGGEITNPSQGVHFVGVVGTYTINPDCTGTGYLCSNHATGQLFSNTGNTACNLKNIEEYYSATSSSFWTDFVAVTIVVTTNGNTFHMLVIPPYDGGSSYSTGNIRTISSTGTRMDNTALPFN